MADRGTAPGTAPGATPGTGAGPGAHPDPGRSDDVDASAAGTTGPLTPEQVLAGPRPVAPPLPDPVLAGPEVAAPGVAASEVAGPAGSTAACAPRRRVPDPVLLVVGVAAVVLGTSAVLDRTEWLAELDTRWWVAGAAMLVGLLLVLASLRPGRRRRR